MRPSASSAFNQCRRTSKAQSCAYAQCFRRLFHTDNVYIFKRYAYVGTLDEQGNKIFE